MDSINSTGLPGVALSSVNQIRNEQAQDPKDTFLPSEKINIIPNKPGLIPTQYTDTFKSSELKASYEPLRKPDDAVSFIKSFNGKLGLSSTIINEKYELMKTDALKLFRIMPSLFFNDISGCYNEKSKLLPRNAPRIIIDGDMHIGNFGTFKGIGRETVWGINDHDQSGKGSPEWDLERLATSAVLAGRIAGLSEDEQKQLLEGIVKKYIKTIREISDRKRNQAYIGKDDANGLIKNTIKESDKKTQKHMLEKYTKTNLSTLEFITSNELAKISDDRKKTIIDSLRDYEKTIGKTPDIDNPLQIFDICEKTGSGGSSYGLDRYWALVKGNICESNPDGLPIILELKQLLPSALTDLTGDLTKANSKSMVDNQKELGGYANSLTGYTKINGFAFLVREREAVKNSIDLDKISDFESLNNISKHAAEVLAMSHGFSGLQASEISKWVGDDEQLISKNLKKFAITYANQTEADFKKFKFK